MLSRFGVLGIGTTELLVILVILLLLFGAKKLPELSRSLGKSVGELRKGIDESKPKDTEKKSEDQQS